MKVIALTKECADEILEKGVEFSGRLHGVLTKDENYIRAYWDKKDFVVLRSGCLFEITTTDEQRHEIHLKTKHGHRGIPVVFSLPLQGEMVKMIGNCTVEFDVDCSNELWRLILDNYRLQTCKRIEIELGIEVNDLLTTDPIICSSYSEKHNTDEETFEKLTSHLILPQLLIKHRLTIGEDNYDLLKEIYTRRSYLFNPSIFKGCEVTEINLTNLDDKAIIEIGELFSEPTETEINVKEERK